MKTRIFFPLIVLAWMLPQDRSTFAWQDQQQPKTVRRVKRAARPTFDKEKSGEIFFKDVYAEGTVGERPDVSAFSTTASQQVATGDEGSGRDASDLWSKIIDASVIEDEVKTLQQEINLLVTTPVMFQTKYDDINQRFEILSMLFAIIRQYDGDVRWTEHAATAQFLFQKAAVASRNGSVKGFQYCKARKEDLQELVRGGSIFANDQIPETVDWSVAANRSPIMVQLETANEDLKRMTSNKSEFQDNADDLLRTSNLVAAMAKVIVQDGMPESDEDTYAKFSMEMRSAATKLKSAVKLNDFDSASAAANALSQSCVDCHSEWR